MQNDSARMRETARVDPDLLKNAFRGHPAGVCVITADDGAGPVGLTATSLSSVSVAPALVMFSVSGLSSSTPTILRSETAIVHLIDERSLHVAKLCATSGIDRFADTRMWTRNNTGEPIFHDACAWLRVRAVTKVDVTTSTVVIAEVLDIEMAPQDAHGTGSPRGALIYHSGQWHALSSTSRIA
ncbi:flavin reductase family protein [Actinomycetes bacterium M1A6_2h]